MLAASITKAPNLLEPGRIFNESTKSALFGLIALALLISGCTMVGPDYVKPTAKEPKQWLESADPKIESKEADFSDWWTVFNDPVLNDLVQAAYQQNLPLQIAGLRIYEARAQLGIAFGFQYPQTQQALGSASINQLSKNAPNSAAADIIQISTSDWMRPGSWMSGVSSAVRSKPVWPTWRPPSRITTIYWCR
jgi:outer membrane protein TolC